MPAEVALGYKFAVLAIPAYRGGEAPLVPDLPNGFAVSVDLPDHALDTWYENIGRFHRDELASCRLFLWSLARSANPEILDAENQLLSRRVYYFFLGMLLAIPYFSAGRLTSLTGANSDGTARARSLTTFARTWYTLGAPMPNVTPGKMRLAASLATILEQHDLRGRRHRFERSIRAFRVACESADLDERFHQFVRAAEGFAAPAHAVQFTDRLARLCAGHCRNHLRLIYRIRSGIEHLHGPYDRMPKRSSKQERHRILLQRTVEAEAVARYLLVTYLQHPALWTHFESRSAIDDFWSMPSARRRALWPTRLAFPAVLRDFNTDEVARYENKELGDGD